ncbi:hypothetical protein [Haloarcula sp. S1AR25-4]|nr:hypothetical protein [Halomicroarcula sp. S1AR25-4]
MTPGVLASLPAALLRPVGTVGTVGCLWALWRLVGGSRRDSTTRP